MNCKVLFLLLLSYYADCLYGASTEPLLNNNSGEEKLENDSRDFFTKFGNFLRDEINNDDYKRHAVNSNSKRDLDHYDAMNDEEQSGMKNQEQDEVITNAINIPSEHDPLEETKKSNDDGGSVSMLQNDNNNKEPGNIPLISGGNFPQIPTGSPEGNKEGGGLPFFQGSNFQLPGGLGDLGQGISQTPKLVWGGFFFVETPMPGASMSNIANMASLMQNGQQMVPGGLQNQIPIPGAG